MGLIPCSKKGVGEFHEFTGKKLEKIENVFIPGTYPNRYNFYFEDLVHVHAMLEVDSLHPNNYNFIGKTVAKAKQFREGEFLVFQFLFTDGADLRFYYKEDDPIEVSSLESGIDIVETMPSINSCYGPSLGQQLLPVWVRDRKG